MSQFEGEYKKILYNNIIKFIIGMCLLIFAGRYLYTHTAETTSLISSFDILLNKTNVTIQKVLGNNRKELQTKYTIQREYNMIIGEIEQNDCFTKTKITDIKNDFIKLKQMDLATFTKEKYHQQITLGSLRQAMTIECTK